jgi:hypothetical protein
MKLFFKRIRTPSFGIEFSGNDEKKVEIIGKLQEMTHKLNKPIGNLQVLETLLEMWSNQQEESSASNEQTLPESPMPSTYIKAGKKDVNYSLVTEKFLDYFIFQDGGYGKHN